MTKIFVSNFEKIKSIYRGRGQNVKSIFEYKWIFSHRKPLLVEINQNI